MVRRHLTVTVFGGTGFLGSEIVRALSAAGFNVRIATRKALTAVLAVLPSPPLTRDQVILMESDNVVTGHTATFSNLGVQPTGFSSLLADCLAALKA